MSTAKTKLRAQLRQARLELSDAEHTLKSRAIDKKLNQAIDWFRVKTLHYFETLPELLEIDTTDFITYLEDTYPEIKLFTPRKIGGTWELVAAKGGDVPSQFDIVLVPMLGFDPVTLHRIGYGGGYYDKFLATQPEARKIGLCYELGKTLKLPTEPHDVPLDRIITEYNLY